VFLPEPQPGATQRLVITGRYFANPGDGTLIWRGWTLSDDAQVVTHHFAGTIVTGDVAAAPIHLNVEMSHSAEMTGAEPVRYGEPIAIDIPPGRPKDFRFRLMASDEDFPDEGVSDAESDWGVMECREFVGHRSAAVECKTWHNGVGQLLRVGGMALLAWHLMTNEWQFGIVNGDYVGDKDTEGPLQKAWEPAPEGQVTELSHTTAVFARLDGQLTLKGATEQDMFASEQSRLVTEQSKLVEMHHDWPETVEQNYATGAQMEDNWFALLDKRWGLDDIKWPEPGSS
jgi:hypothetical protein